LFARIFIYNKDSSTTVTPSAQSTPTTPSSSSQSTSKAQGIFNLI